MNRKFSATGMTFFVLLFAGVLAIGLLMPSIHDWSGADQSRPSPQVDLTLKLVLGFMIAAWLALPLLPWKRSDVTGSDLEPSPEEPASRRFQFNVRTLLILMSVVAITIVGLSNSLTGFVLLLICAMLVFSLWMVTHRLSFQWQVVSLVACMYFPYAWVVFNKGFRGVDWGTVILAGFGLPSFLPSLLIGRFVFEQRVEEMPWLLVVITAFELAIGVLLIRLGPKRAIAWMILVLFCSLLGSWGLHAGSRI